MCQLCTTFPLLSICFRLDIESLTVALELTSELDREIAFNLASIYQSAGLFFRGFYPFESPHFSWGETIKLPWFEEYWPVKQGVMTGLEIGSDVALIANRLVHSGQLLDEAMPLHQVTYRSTEQCLSDRSKMQGLSVEVMICAEHALLALGKSELHIALLWQSGAYENLSECTCHAQRILGAASFERFSAPVIDIGGRSSRAFASVDGGPGPRS